MTTPESYRIFDRALLRQRLARLARQFGRHDFLHHETAARLLERRGDVQRDFSRILDLGCHDGVLTCLLRAQGSRVVAADLSADFLAAIPPPVAAADEECLPFAPYSFDLIVSNLNFHAVNDLPGVLLQCRYILAPGGLLLAAMLGGSSLWQLRQCLVEAEQRVTGGVSPRVAPLVDLRSAAGLLQRAGYVLPVADREIITMIYPDALALMHDLRGMGFGNILYSRQRHAARRAIFVAAAALYVEKFPASGGGITADFEIIYLHGWTPPDSQACYSTST